MVLWDPDSGANLFRFERDLLRDFSFVVGSRMLCSGLWEQASVPSGERNCLRGSIPVRVIEDHWHWCRDGAPPVPREAELSGPKGPSRLSEDPQRAQGPPQRVAPVGGSTLVPSGPNDPEGPRDIGLTTTCLRSVANDGLPLTVSRSIDLRCTHRHSPPDDASPLQIIKPLQWEGGRWWYLVDGGEEYEK